MADTQANGITTKSNTTPIGTWRVIAVLSATKGDALNSDNISIYIDGKKSAGQIQPAWMPAALRIMDGCLIGAAVSGDRSHQNLHFDGVLDELLIFSRALTEREIQIFSSRN